MVGWNDRLIQILVQPITTSNMHRYRSVMFLRIEFSVLDISEHISHDTVVLKHAICDVVSEVGFNTKWCGYCLKSVPANSDFIAVTRIAFQNGRVFFT